MCQDRGLGKGLFERAEHLGMVRPQANRVSLQMRRIKGMTMLENPTMNQPIEVGEAQECLHCFEVCRCRPGADSIGLGHVH